jgi:hypothetical protein
VCLLRFLTNFCAARMHSSFGNPNSNNVRTHSSMRACRTGADICSDVDSELDGERNSTRQVCSTVTEWCSAVQSSAADCSRPCYSCRSTRSQVQRAGVWYTSGVRERCEEGTALLTQCWFASSDKACSCQIEPVRDGGSPNSVGLLDGVLCSHLKDVGQKLVSNIL